MVGWRIGHSYSSAEAKSCTGTAAETVLPNMLKKSRSLLDSDSYTKVELQNVTESSGRLLNLASESHRGLLQAFYAFLSGSVPGFKLESIGVVDQNSIDYVCTHLYDRLPDVLGDGGLLIFRARQMESTENAVVFRGDIDGTTVDVIVNSVK